MGVRSNRYIGEIVQRNEEIITVPITGTSNPFCLDYQSSSITITKVWAVSPYSALTASWSVRNGLGGTAVTNQFTGNMAPFIIYTATFPGNVSAVSVNGGPVLNFSSSMVTGSQPILGFVAFKRT